MHKRSQPQLSEGCQYTPASSNVVNCHSHVSFWNACALITRSRLLENAVLTVPMACGGQRTDTSRPCTSAAATGPNLDLLSSLTAALSPSIQMWPCSMTSGR